MIIALVSHNTPTRMKGMTYKLEQAGIKDTTRELSRRVHGGIRMTKIQNKKEKS